MLNIDKNSMAEGYLFMGKINLEICNEFFHLENEGENLINEMGTEEA